MSNADFRKLLRSHLLYDPETGMFIRRETTGRNGRWKAGSLVGAPHSSGYLMTMIDGKNHFLHRLAFDYMGLDPSDKVIDHINGNPTDNRFANLRLVEQAHNCRNAKMPKSNTSGVVGVVWDKSKNKWTAQITVNRKNIFLGRFDDIELATLERKSAEKRYGFHPNHGR